MKKTVLILILGFLLIGTLSVLAVNAYSAGDLIVEGNVGIGTAGPQMPLHVVAGNPASTFSSSNSYGIGVALRGTDITGQVNGALFNGERANTVSTSELTSGISGRAVHYGSQNLTRANGLIGGFYNSIKAASGGTVSNAMGIYSRVIFNNTITGTITKAIDFKAAAIDAEDGAITNAYGLYSEAHLKDTGTLTNAYGAWFEKQTAGTNNYGIVLDGDGAGADIVFGPTQNARLYSGSGELYVQDGAGNVTQISPHDPETGEWIFYSKNVKTGRVVRVDMERLVKAVEKITGERFMTETLKIGQ